MELLNAHEARVLGVLIEKETLRPELYPLTLLFLVKGCNQKRNRNPYVILTEVEVLQAVVSLMAMGYISETKSKYKNHYSHNLGAVLNLPRQAIPILGVLLLRGPLTTNDVRKFTDKMYRFGNVEAVEGYLRMMSRDREEPLVMKLPIQQGDRKPRWMHLLSGTGDNVPYVEPTYDEMILEVMDLRKRLNMLEIRLGLTSNDE